MPVRVGTSVPASTRSRTGVMLKRTTAVAAVATLALAAAPAQADAQAPSDAIQPIIQNLPRTPSLPPELSPAIQPGPLPGNPTVPISPPFVPEILGIGGQP